MNIGYIYQWNISYIFGNKIIFISFLINQYFSSLCLNYRNVFLHEQILYNEHDLQLHIEKGSEKHQIKHEKCTFCGTLTFDLDQIYFHLYNYHSVCTICQQNGVQFCFFNSEYERVSFLSFLLYQ